MKVIIAILAILSVVMSAKIEFMSLKSLTNFKLDVHYENPFAENKTANCHGSTEEPQVYKGLDDYFGCMPLAMGHQDLCYSDYPIGNTATPMPIFTDAKNNTRCVLVCAGMTSGVCAQGAECKLIPVDGNSKLAVCLYKKP